MNKPTHLYHYTSIEGLAHILKSRQIRFSRLDLLDDMTEGQSLDLVDWRKFFFVSCWTDNVEESIPLWNLYTPDMKGVRIKLPIDMFKKFVIDLTEVPKCVNIVDTSKAPKGAVVTVYSYLPYEKMHGENYFVLPPSFAADRWPFPVEYTDDANKLNQNLIDFNESTQNSEIRSFEVAKYKKKVWAFQGEWRFRLYCHHAAPRSLKNKLSEKEYFDLMVEKLKDMREGIPMEYFFMELDDNAFKNIEVLLGPKVEPAHEIIVRSLTNNYCGATILRKSNLTGQIR